MFGGVPTSRRFDKDAPRAEMWCIVSSNGRYATNAKEAFSLEKASFMFIMLK